MVRWLGAMARRSLHVVHTAPAVSAGVHPGPPIGACRPEQICSIVEVRTGAAS